MAKNKKSITKATAARRAAKKAAQKKGPTPTRAELFRFCKENRNVLVETHFAVQRAAMAVNRLEMFTFGMVKFLKDEGTLDLKELNTYMSALLDTDDLAKYWDSDIAEFIAKQEAKDEAHTEVEVPLSALEELANRMEAEDAVMHDDPNVDFDEVELISEDEINETTVEVTDV